MRISLLHGGDVRNEERCDGNYSFLIDTGVAIRLTLHESVWRRATKAFASHAARRRAQHGDQPRRFIVDFIIGTHAAEKSDRLSLWTPVATAPISPNSSCFRYWSVNHLTPQADSDSL